MVTKILAIPFTIIGFALKTKNTSYNVKDKIQIFKTLVSLHIKTIFWQHKNEKISQRIFGFRVFGYSYSSLMALFKEMFLLKEYFFETTNKKPLIIDCGANIGMAIIYFKKLYPKCSIIAFEPSPYAFELLQKNCYSNNLSNVILINKGLSRERGKIEFYTNDNKGSLSSSIYKSRGGSNKLKIDSVNLSEYIKNKKIDLIKIDIEGAEREVIEELVEAKALNNANQYIIEYHHNLNIGANYFSEFLGFFEKVKYEYNIKANYYEKGSFQDILIHFYKKHN